MMTLADSAQALGAQVVGSDCVFTSVSTDSRALERDALFIALRGPRFDGHDYLSAARASGAAAAMVERVPADAAGMALLVVADTRVALGTLARRWRARFRVPVIAVVGSNGKTTVKEMIAAILRAHFGTRETLATADNLNNDIGLPLTVLRLRAAHTCAVLELGMNHPGETGYLAHIAQPTIAVINNAQREHQEFMRSVRDVAAEHADVIRELPDDGTAVLNRDDPHYAFWAEIAGRRTVHDFGTTTAAAVRGTFALGPATSDVDIATAAGTASAVLQVPGAHHAANALAAAAASLAAGASLAAVSRGLASFRAVKGRMELKRGRGGAQLIDDTYNANPDSVRAAIDALSATRPPRVLILGDMGEVGEQGDAFHQEIGAYAKARGIDRLLALGAAAATAAQAFGANGEHFEAIDALISRAEALAALKGSMLVKGSRFMRMERVVERLLEEEDAGCS